MIFARCAISMALTPRPRVHLLSDDNEEAAAGAAVAVTVGDEGARADEGPGKTSNDDDGVSSDKYVSDTISAISNRLFPIASLCDQEDSANVVKKPDAKKPLGVQVAKALKNGGVKVSFSCLITTRLSSS